ncbi:pyridoxamine 5'-phosphate oxidase family protein [Halomonas sp. DP5Y7-2]|uniref:FAD-binding oxidoreductase n=1 Tax=Halomonas sp. DP5Y7-2 TaxID=2859076 RepID=UPI001C99E070|nr:pyridoxamine 5'-phosphate oxidase family protein [Halomonas sp. DP5Y7-2]MBY5982719.1 pyridoxamine 5'-phosphate oxidase family protein [Halomonas sp. DP5Y7-2]
MTQVPTTPFHQGEREAQHRAGVGDVASWAGGFIRDFLPDQHRDFHTALPFLVMAGSDLNGRTWVTVLEGADGFLHSPTPYQLSLRTEPEPSDPLAERLFSGGDVGVLGIDLASRRRNRFNGRISRSSDGYVIDVQQSFGNCPQYIQQRTLSRTQADAPGTLKRFSQLTRDHIHWIERADTMFMGSGHHDHSEARHNGFDASHRGGAPGFVKVESEQELVIPDYAGNNFFNTIGNLLKDPRVGLVFVDFNQGSLLHISGTARIDWSPGASSDPQARRFIHVTIERILERRHVLSLRWQRDLQHTRDLTIKRKVRESKDVTSFYLAPVDQHPLLPATAGQHLNVDMQVPGQLGTTSRSYSLSGDPADSQHYRLSIKREAYGLVSRYLHDVIGEGAIIKAGRPSGDFVLPDKETPVALISAGIGLTPMVAMLHAAARQGRPAWYLHGARRGNQHPLRQEVNELVARHAHLHQRIFYSQPAPEDRLGHDFHVAGRLSATAVLETAGHPETHYLVCGPSAFVANLTDDLISYGVPAARLHSESF